MPLLITTELCHRMGKRILQIRIINVVPINFLNCAAALTRQELSLSIQSAHVAIYLLGASFNLRCYGSY